MPLRTSSTTRIHCALKLTRANEEFTDKGMEDFYPEEIDGCLRWVFREELQAKRISQEQVCYKFTGGVQRLIMSEQSHLPFVALDLWHTPRGAEMGYVVYALHNSLKI